MSIDDAIALAQVRPATTPTSSRPGLGGLTPRETEVAGRVVSGLTNRQIGEALVITEKTAANHVQRVLDKLGVHSRTQLAARSAELGIEPISAFPELQHGGGRSGHGGGRSGASAVA